MNRFDIINRIGDKYRVGNTETGEFSYAQALKTVGKDIKDYQKATTGTQHKFLDIRFENERLVVLVECKNKFSRWDKAKIQGQLQDYVRFEKAYSDKKIVAILAETDGDEVWVWFGQSVIIDDEHRMEEETVLRTFEEYENLCFGRVNDKIKVVDSIKTLNEKLHSDGINEKLRSQFVGTCLLALKNGLVYKNVKETLDPKTGKKLAPERVVLKSIIDVINTIVETKLVPVPSLVDGYYHLYFDAPDTIYGLDATIRDVLDLDYSQFRAAIEFLYPEAEFSTEHGVKGEEYDNVVFVISKGWNQYQFETYAPMITGRTPIPNGKQTSYERNRNLFYVCCSRPRKRLFFFVSVPIDASFRVFLDDLVGAENIYTYGQYLEAKQ